jgi:hypothetical protein
METGMDDNGRMLSNVDITKENINKRLKNLKVNKTPGVDEIVPRILMKNAGIEFIEMVQRRASKLIK